MMVTLSLSRILQNFFDLAQILLGQFLLQRAQAEKRSEQSASRFSEVAVSLARTAAAPKTPVCCRVLVQKGYYKLELED